MEEIERLKLYAKKVAFAQGKRQGILNEIAAYKESVEALELASAGIEKAQALIHEVAEKTQASLKMHLTEIVQLALDSCLPQQEYAFDIVFDVKRGQTDAELRFLKQGFPVDPMTASGGGVVDIASFALRIAAWTLGKSRPILVLDEPMKNLSKEYRPLAAEMIKELSHRLGLQIIMVTHDETFVEQADRVFRVRSRKGRSRVDVVDGQ